MEKEESADSLLAAAAAHWPGSQPGTPSADQVTNTFFLLLEWDTVFLLICLCTFTWRQTLCTYSVIDILGFKVIKISGL
jgi:hypothetical protein